MTTTHTPESLLGRKAVDLQGDKIGSVGQVYVNDATGRPDWVTINTGFFGLRESFAPLQGSSFDGENLVLPFDKEVVKSAPDIEDASHLNADDQDALYSYYNRYMTTDFDLGRSNSSETVGDLPGSPGTYRHAAEPAQRQRLATR